MFKGLNTNYKIPRWYVRGSS